MFTACNRYGEVQAENAHPEDGPFYCPSCHAEVILKQGPIKVAHFAHRADTDCSFAGQEESVEHRLVKQEIYQALLHVPGVSEVQVERNLQEVRPDVSFRCNGTFVAIEVQVSTLSSQDIEQRTLAYARKNIAVLWTPPFSLSMFEERYAPQEWERYLHALYFGKVYYWSKGIELQPVQFQPYMLPPSYYANERRSKRFVSLSLLEPVLITDLTAIWRREWRTFPRARLWCQVRKWEQA